jgi:TP901 family phage tail tape measure protein
MARTSATISVGADTRQLERDIQSALSRDFKFKGFNEKVFTQPLGRISGAANEFQKSLDASNARVIAFGASAGLIYTVEKAFSSLVRSTIDVQKSLTDINVILNVSAKTLDQFGNSLFDIAKNTGQSFNVVAQAATELSRQGLGLEETLKRTQDALILTRLSGLDTVSAVEALTATINSFNKAGLDSTVIINKLANVDAAFAVSSGDLAEAIKRVGSSASDAGVDFDELLAIVTSVQQTTARGGAVIGNSLKTIFTRIQRTETLDQLENLGIKVRDLQGNTLPAIQVLSNLSNTFNNLADSQKAQVAETVGGIFQINILRAALADLGKEYSVYDRALQTANNSTDQAIQRNEALNQTLSALINQTFQNLTRISSSIGEISLGPTFKNTLELLNKGLESLSTDSDTVGGKIGKGILEGIGTFISGPGVILITAVFGKLLLNLGKFASQSLQTLLSVNTQAEQRAQIQAKINQVLAQEPALVAAIYNKQISVLELENKILNIIKLQTLERERAASISTVVAGNLVTRGVTSKGGSLKVKSAGFVPNFSAQEIYGALAGGYMPGNIRKMNIPGQGNVTYNSAETVRNFPGMTQPAIMPPQGSKAGKNYQKEFSSAHGFNPYANAGFIPNFASYNVNGQYYKSKSVLARAINDGKVSLEAARLAGYTSSAEQKSLTNKQKSNNPFYKSSSTLLTLRREGVTDGYTFKPKGKPPLQVKFPVAAFNPRSTGFKLDTLKENLSSVIDKSIKKFAEEIYATKKISPPIDLPSTVEAAKQKSEGLAGAVEGTIGGIFEAAFRASFGKSVKATKGGGFDVASIPKDLPLFFNAPGSTPPAVGVKGDFKNSDSGGNRESMAIKILKAERPDLLNYITKKNAASGFIPNFTALDNAIGREIAAGTSTSRIRVGKDARLTSSANPLGLGVYNTKDEPKGLGQGIQRYGSKAKMAGAAAGFIPNFAGLSFNPGGLGALDPAVANREVGAQFGKILGKLKTQEITIDQANLSLKKLSSTYGLAADSQNRFNQILQSRSSQYAASARNATIAIDNSKKGFEKLSNAGLALSLVLPIALQTISQFNQGNRKLQVGIDAFSTFLSLTAAGATLGPYGAAGGAIAGGGLGIFQYFKGLEGINLEKLKNDIQNLQDEFNNTSTSVNQILPLIEKYKEVQASALPDNSKLEALTNIQNQITDNLGKIGPDFRDAIINAIKNQNYDEVGFIINKALTQKSAQLSNLTSQTIFESIRGKTIEDKNAAGGISKALTGLQTPSGKNIIQELATQPGGKEKISAVSEQLGGLYTLRGTLKEKQAKQQSLLDDLAAGVGTLFGGDSGLESQQSKKIREEIAQNTVLLKTNLQNILNSVEPLYQATDETRAEFERLSKIAQSVTLSEEAADKVIKDTKQYLDNIRDTQEKIAALLKSGISTVDQYILAFKNGTLNAKDAQEFYKNTFALQNDPLKMLGKSQNDLNMSVATTILNEDSRNKVMKELTIEEEKLRAKLANRQITEDDYLKSLEGLRDIIILRQRRENKLFAEDFRGGRQTARESRLLSKEGAKLEDFAGAFFDEFDNSAADSFRQAQLGAADTARTIKSEFNNAFLSFANGTATASDAFTKMALNISDKIQQLALEFSTNLIFGKLFGTTSNLFGGGGGGFDLGSLFGFNRGGVVKGYSSGGNVTGGSGTKDDVPAMLSAGEYVIKKSAVKKYGSEYLQNLNQGKVKKAVLGGLFDSPFKNKSYFDTYNEIRNFDAAAQGRKDVDDYVARERQPGGSLYATPEINVGTTNFVPDAANITQLKFGEMKSGGKVKKFAAGGEASYEFGNYFTSDFDPISIAETGQTLYRPKDGKNVTDGLSLMAILDPNNPQNEARKRAESLYINRINEIDQYLKYVEDVRQQNIEAYKENVKLNQQIRDDYNKQKNQKSMGAYTQFGLGALGAGLGFLKSGGPVQKFADGGSSKDDIPALLMGGEFVMRKEAVNLYGKRFFDELNNGRIKKFANGGQAGSPNNSETISNYSPVSNVNVTVNVTKDSVSSEVSQDNTQRGQEDEALKAKDLADKVRSQVMRVITEQQRPGGLLSSAVYKKL